MVKLVAERPRRRAVDSSRMHQAQDREGLRPKPQETYNRVRRKSGATPIKQREITGREAIMETGDMPPSHENLELSPGGKSSNERSSNGNLPPVQPGGFKPICNLFALMREYKVSKDEIAIRLNLTEREEVLDRIKRRFPRNKGMSLENLFDEWIGLNEDRHSEYFPRLITAALAELFKERGADEESVYRMLMIGDAAGSLAWLLQSKSMAGLQPADDERVAKMCGLKNKWSIVNAYRLYKDKTQTSEFAMKLADFLFKYHRIPKSITYNSLLGMLPNYDSVAPETVRRVPLLERSDWLRIDATVRGDAGVSVDIIMAELLARPDRKFEKVDASETNSTSVMFIADDDSNAPKIQKGARVQIDLARRVLEPGKYYLIIVQATKRRRDPFLRKFVRDNGRGMFVAVSESVKPIEMLDTVTVAGKAWRQTTDHPFSDD